METYKFPGTSEQLFQRPQIKKIMSSPVSKLTKMISLVYILLLGFGMMFDDASLRCDFFDFQREIEIKLGMNMECFALIARFLLYLWDGATLQILFSLAMSHFRGKKLNKEYDSLANILLLFSFSYLNFNDANFKLALNWRVKSDIDWSLFIVRVSPAFFMYSQLNADFPLLKQFVDFNKVGMQVNDLVQFEFHSVERNYVRFLMIFNILSGRYLSILQTELFMTSVREKCFTSPNSPLPFLLLFSHVPRFLLWSRLGLLMEFLTPSGTAGKNKEDTVKDLASHFLFMFSMHDILSPAVSNLLINYFLMIDVNLAESEELLPLPISQSYSYDDCEEGYKLFEFPFFGFGCIVFRFLFFNTVEGLPRELFLLEFFTTLSVKTFIGQFRKTQAPVFFMKTKNLDLDLCTPIRLLGCHLVKHFFLFFQNFFRSHFRKLFF